MNLFSQLLLVLLFLMPLSASASYQVPSSNFHSYSSVATKVHSLPLEVSRAALDMNSASCDQISALSPEDKLTFFALLQYTQSPSALSFIIGPQCSFLGETQILAYINDPQLTLRDATEVLYYSPTLDMLFVSYQEKNTIAYAMPREGGTEPLDFFIEHKSQARQYADAAKRFAQFSQELQSSSASTSSSSSMPRSTIVVTPPILRIAVSASDSSRSMQNGIASGAVASIPSINQEQRSTQTTFASLEGTGITIWQILIVLGAIALLIFIYARRRNSLPI